MIDGSLEAVLQRDRLIVAGALAAIVVVAWAYVVWRAADMDMGGRRLRLSESALAFRFVVLRKIGRPATSDFCNKICQELTLARTRLIARRSAEPLNRI